MALILIVLIVLIIQLVKQVLLTLLTGILAGLAIGLGGFLYILMIRYVQGELGTVLGSILFSVGLLTVCCCSLSLYTGKVGGVFEHYQQKYYYILH